MSELTPGFVLKSRYRIISLLGKGGMGEVYLAEDQSLATGGISVAIRKLPVAREQLFWLGRALHFRLCARLRGLYPRCGGCLAGVRTQQESQPG